MTDITLREQAITGGLQMPVSVASDCAVMTEVAQAEACVAKNKGIILGCIANLPSPVLAILKSLAHFMLVPLHVIASLKLDAIYNGLNDFANSNSCQPPAPTPLSSDCTPS